MSLFNIDKNSDDRLQPIRNAVDVLLNRKHHATDSISPRAEGTNTAAKVTTKNSKIIANDGSNNLGLFGFDDTGRMVVKVAKSGYDANNAADANLIFNSSQNVFKIVQTGTIASPTISISDGGAGIWSSSQSSTSLAHGLTYAPAIIGFYATGVDNIPLPFTTMSRPSTTSATWLTLWISTDTTNIYINAQLLGLHAAQSFGPVNVKYYILQETAS